MGRVMLYSIKGNHTEGDNNGHHKTLELDPNNFYAHYNKGLSLSLILKMKKQYQVTISLKSLTLTISMPTITKASLFLDLKETKKQYQIN